MIIFSDNKEQRYKNVEQTGTLTVNLLSLKTILTTTHSCRNHNRNIKTGKRRRKEYIYIYKSAFIAQYNDGYFN